MTAKEKIELINKTAEFFYDETESWEGDLGEQIAYLLWAIADDDTYAADSLDDCIVPFLDAHDIPRDDIIYKFITIVED